MNTKLLTYAYNLQHRRWFTVSSQRKFLEDLGKKLGFKHVEDWCSLKQATIKLNGGYSILKEHGNVYKMLQSAFPEHNWKLWEFKHAPGMLIPGFDKQKKFGKNRIYKENSWTILQGSTKYKSMRNGIL